MYFKKRDFKINDKIHNWIIKSEAYCDKSGHAKVDVECDCINHTKTTLRVSKLMANETKQCEQCQHDKTKKLHKIVNHVPHKECSKCKKLLTLDNYQTNNKNHDTLNNHCKLCARNNSLLLNYGITNERFEFLLKSQDYKCAICGIHQNDLSRKILHIDHNHKYDFKHLRGLLCPNCNKGLGCFQDSIKFLQKAIDYLKIHSFIVVTNNGIRSTPENSLEEYEKAWAKEDKMREEIWDNLEYESWPEDDFEFMYYGG